MWNVFVSFSVKKQQRSKQEPSSFVVVSFTMFFLKII